MDYSGIALTVIKFVTILSAAFFGVLALLVDYKRPAPKPLSRWEYRRPRRGRITRWGRIALLGVIVSAVLGAVTEGVSRYRDMKSAEARAAQHQRTLTEISRAILLLKPQRVRLSFRVPEAVLGPGTQGGSFAFQNQAFSREEFGAELQVNLYVLKTPVPDADLDRINRGRTGPKSDFSIWALGSRMERPTGMGQSSDGYHFSVAWEVLEDQIFSSARVVSLPDLPGAQLVVSIRGGNGRLGDVSRGLLKELAVSELVIRFGGLNLTLPASMLRVVDGEGGAKLCVYTFPKTLGEILELQR